MPDRIRPFQTLRIAQGNPAFGAEVIDAYSDRGQDKLREFLSNPDVAPLVRLEAYFDNRIKAFRASTMPEAACSAISAPKPQTTVRGYVST